MRSLPGERDLQHRICTTGFRDHNFKTEFKSHNLVQETEFVDTNLKLAKQMKKVSFQNLMTELELCTEFQGHNLVHKTEFVDTNLKFAYEMTMKFVGFSEKKRIGPREFYQPCFTERRSS